MTLIFKKSNIADKSVNKPPPITGKYGEEFVRQFYSSKSTLFLKEISEDKIYTMLMELEPHKPTGIDGLQAKFLIDSAQSIRKPLTHLFLKGLKNAIVIPIHKKNYKVEPGNYRPVSILSIISKIFEIVVCEQLTDYLTCNNYIYELVLQQSFSTESCLIHISDFIRKKTGHERVCWYGSFRPPKGF